MISVNRHHLSSLVGIFLVFLFVISCSSSTHKWLEHRQLKAEHVSALNLGSTHNMIIAGERSNLRVNGMVGNHTRELTDYVTFHVQGPGSIDRENGRVYFEGSSPNGKDGTQVWVTYDHSQFNTKTPPSVPRVVKSNRVTIYVRPRSEKIEMPEVRKYEPRRLQKPVR